MLYEAIKHTYDMPERWSKNYETLSPASFFVAFEFFVNQIQSKNLLSYGILNLIVTLAALDNTDTQLSELSAKVKTVGLAFFNPKEFYSGFTMYMPKVFGETDKISGEPASKSIVIFACFMQAPDGTTTKSFFVGRIVNKKTDKACMRSFFKQRSYVEARPFFEMNGLFYLMAHYNAFRSVRDSIETVKPVNHSAKVSGGLGLMVPDESTRVTPKRPAQSAIYESEAAEEDSALHALADIAEQQA